MSATLSTIPTASPEWQLQDAKNRFSQLVKAAVAGEPQSVTLHGKPTAVVISATAYAQLQQAPQNSLLDALLAPGLLEDGDEDLFARSRDVSAHRDLVL